jgi:hypothetical protein
MEFFMKMFANLTRLGGRLASQPTMPSKDWEKGKSELMKEAINFAAANRETSQG